MVEYLEQEYTLVERPLWWHKAGLSQTRTGYGRKLVSSRCVQLADGRVRRIYITQISNAASAWVILDGRKLFIR